MPELAICSSKLLFLKLDIGMLITYYTLKATIISGILAIYLARVFIRQVKFYICPSLGINLGKG